LTQKMICKNCGKKILVMRTEFEICWMHDNTWSRFCGPFARYAGCIAEPSCDLLIVWDTKEMKDVR
jgi:hypothetical protein